MAQGSNKRIQARDETCVRPKKYPCPAIGTKYLELWMTFRYAWMVPFVLWVEWSSLQVPYVSGEYTSLCFCLC